MNTTTLSTTIKRKNPPPIITGKYQLAKEALLEIITNAIPDVTTQHFEDLWKIIPEPTPNPMNPTGPPILRRQCAFGANYHFSGQISKNYGSIHDAPLLVQICLRDTLTRIPLNIRKLYTGAHINFYLGGKASLAYHKDNEGELTGLPIFSYTFIQNGPDYRYFVITTDKKGKHKVACLPIRNTDLIIMAGKRFQKDFFHGVPKTMAKKFIHQRRINITIRPWAGKTQIT